MHDAHCLLFETTYEYVGKLKSTICENTQVTVKTAQWYCYSRCHEYVKWNS